MKTIKSFLSILELPLLTRELIESSRRKRTYVLRFLIAAVLLVVAMMSWSSIRSSRPGMLSWMGYGGEIAVALYVTDLIAIFLLLPALACSAISTEREKQTLGLILISRITPTKLIIEKLLTRLVPVLVLIVMTTPMFALAYVLGGVSVSALFGALLALLTAAMQVSTAAIACSALFRTTLESFWATYLLLIAFALGPPVLYMLEILPDFQLVTGLGGDQAAGLFVIYIAAAGEGLEGRFEWSKILPAIIPVWSVAIALLIISGLAVTRSRDVAPISTKAIGRVLARVGSIITWPLRWRKHLRRLTHPTAERHRKSEATVPPREPPVTNPVAWREVRTTGFTSWRPWTIWVTLLLIGEWWWISELGGSSACEMVTTTFDLGGFIIALLIIMALTCRTIASEREHQTLDLLLTTPITNHELLSQKLTAVHRVMWLEVGSLVAFGLTRVGFQGVRWWWFDDEYFGSMFVNMLFAERTRDWWRESLRFFFGLITHAWLYMTLVKWIAVWFSLRFNTLMKAMLGSIITVVLLCTAVAATAAILMVLTDNSPDQFPVWWFLSPVTILVMNELDELQEVHDSFDSFNGDNIVLLINLAMYGTLTFGVRAFVQRQLARLLNRRDDVTPSDA